MSKPRSISLAMSLFPVLFLIIALSWTILIAHFDDLPTIPIILAAAVAGGVAMLHGYGWNEIEEGMINGITMAMKAILILMAIGILIGTWIQAGIVPTMIYYGLKIISPGFFLLATLFICSIVSLGTGSSWSTAGTIGVALIAIGQGLGIPVEMVAGAVISGAYLGDKLSPLSDTTNLAPAVAGAELFDHIKHMVWTTGPGYIIAIVLYALMGLQFSGSDLDGGTLDAMLRTLETTFIINPFLLLAPVLVIAMVVMRIPALPAILAGGVIGGMFAMAMQGTAPTQILWAAYDYSEVFSTTGIAAIDSLLNRGGLTYMMPTVGLIIAALSFGGIMEKAGMLKRIAEAMLSWAHSTGSLITTTIISCIAMNIVAAEQYMSIVIPGRMYRTAFEKKGLHPKNLSRALEDSATLTSPLIPWNSCGAFMGATLGVNPLLYLPYAFVNLSNPIVSIIYGYTGFTIEPAEEQDDTVAVPDEARP